MCIWNARKWNAQSVPMLLAIWLISTNTSRLFTGKWRTWCALNAQEPSVTDLTLSATWKGCTQRSRRACAIFVMLNSLTIVELNSTWNVSMACKLINPWLEQYRSKHYEIYIKFTHREPPVEQLVLVDRREALGDPRDGVARLALAQHFGEEAVFSQTQISVKDQIYKEVLA